jgi:hypothetical protein
MAVAIEQCSRSNKWRRTDVVVDNLVNQYSTLMLKRERPSILRERNNLSAIESDLNVLFLARIVSTFKCT